MPPVSANKQSARAKRTALSSVSNSLAVLEFLIESGEAGVSEIARHVGVTVGTSHRLVATLVATGWAEQNPGNRKYQPSHKVVTLAQRLRTRLNTREIAHRHLVELVEAVHETGNLAILTESKILYVDKVTSDQPFGIEARIGSRLPAYCTALGKTLVANLPDDEVDEYLKLVETVRSSGQKPRPRAAGVLRTELRKARSNGYALDAGEYLPDVYCVAAPISGVGSNVVAAISVSVPRSRFEPGSARFVEAVGTTAAAMSEELARLGLGETALEFAVPELI